jgi:DNA-binding transcriptional MocR family regulator
MNSLEHNYTLSGKTASGIAESIERGIREGALRPGQVLPPMRTLAVSLSVSPATVAAAYRIVKLRGLVSAEGRRGTRIGWHPPLAARAASPIPRGLRNLADGNPDPSLLPRLQGPRVFRSRLYGEATNLPELTRLAASQLKADGIPHRHVAVLGGALDAIERVLQSHLRPGDRVAVEDPGYTGVLDLVAALGLVAEPVGLDDSGPLPESLEKALRAGARALIVTPRAQNPMGAAFDEKRASVLRELLDGHQDVLVIEDDHAGAISGAPAHTLCHGKKTRFAVVRSVSKALGPDLRLAILAGDATTVARVEGRQALGAGWVSHVLQQLVISAWSDPKLKQRLRKAADVYGQRRAALLSALRSHGLPAHGRSGLNVWVPVPEEVAMVAALAQEGWAARAGEPYRLKSPPALRLTISTLSARDTQQVADAIAAALRPGRRTATA